MNTEQEWDLVIIGAGMAGLTLARQLLMRSRKRVLHLEKRAQVPISRQKVGESNVQVAGYYLGKVLEMEEYLFHEHLMKYNLRFLWKTPGAANDDITDYGQSYIRSFSNIPCYQLDRNKFEGELIRRNQEDDHYQLLQGVSGLEVTLNQGKNQPKKLEEAGHEVRFQHQGETRVIRTPWVIDSSGRSRQMARKMRLKKSSDISHHASFFWVDGTVNIERLTRSDSGQRRLNRQRRHLGHLPSWLATNHFMGEGFWFWVIPLQNRTSFGLVYDSVVIDPKTVNTEKRLLSWLLKQFPLFNGVLEDRPIIDFTTLLNFSHDCHQTIHKDGWAMSGESGRFTDPLYSPGGDTIAIHNTLITDAILTENGNERALKIALYESMFKVAYFSFVPSFRVGYQSLGDQECFAMKYTWELSIYFAFYVFPFINDLMTDRRFLIPYFKNFSELGVINKTVQNYIAAYYQWKKSQTEIKDQPTFFDFTEIETLKRAEQTFYQVGVSPAEGIAIVKQQLKGLRELARLIITHIDAAVSGDPSLLKNNGYGRQLDLGDRVFNEEQICKQVTTFADDGQSTPWDVDPQALWRQFQPKEKHKTNQMGPMAKTAVS